ncbi:ribosome small subunit-dependent GTPase A [Marinilabiliaceae bacterium N1Y90]|nr:ribosome small subunit-dependent GTPase A [Marinilabiliaceae bacterium N1Y90]
MSALNELGYNNELERYRIEHELSSFDVGRVISEHKERYTVQGENNEFDAELIGNLRFTASSRNDFPAVGDWVAFSEFDEGKALIHAIYERHSIIERQAVGKTGEVQIIASNIDFGMIVQAVDRDFNLNRLERYLTICNASRVTPLIVLSKIDLIDTDDLENILMQITQRIKDVELVCVSNQLDGYEPLRKIVKSGRTYCLLGSSGVGKSTLLNGLSGKEEMKTSEISTSVNKGRHTTTHRELIVLEGGGILIDNPGMREVGITDLGDGLETTFESILSYAKDCRYKDCTHMHESGCAIIEAVDNGDIDESAYNNYRKMEKERMHFESDAQDRKKKDKDLGKLIKQVKKQRKNNKY